jgi:hypothetical protein
MAQAERCKIDEAVYITGLSERTLQNLSARGEIWGAAKLGRRWTYDRLRLRAWVKAGEAATESRRTSISEMGFGMRELPLAGDSIASRFKQVLEQKLRGG